MSAEKESDNKPDRRARRKIKTKSLLINAAIKIFNEKGINNTSVNDITEEADVAYGTFYNYFPSIEDLAPEVIYVKMKEHVEQVRLMQHGNDDIAVVVAVSVREMANKLLSDKTMHWLSERPFLMLDGLMRGITEDAAAHNRVGVSTGRFVLPASQKRVHTYVLWGMTGLLQDALRNPEEAEGLTDDITRIYLRVLGLSDKDINDVLARRPSL
ncbi:MAG: TetR/AcrR family transcriptional regulator [Halioglobus sp.]